MKEKYLYHENIRNRNLNNQEAMKKPLKKDFTTPWAFDDKFVKVDRRAYAKALEEYIEYLEGVITELKIEYLEGAIMELKTKKP